MRLESRWTLQDKAQEVHHQESISYWEAAPNWNPTS